MWRKREEGLEYWLSGESLHPKPFFVSKFIKWFSRRIDERHFPTAVREQSLDISVRNICLNDALPAICRVRDGLAKLRQDPDSLTEEAPESFESSFSISSVNLLGALVARSLLLPHEQKTLIRQAELALASFPRSLAMGLKSGRIRTMRFLENKPTIVNTSKWLLRSKPKICGSMDQIAKFPHSRVSVDIDALSASEREGFLHEAEALKGIVAEKCELMAVFRCVPIEMISRLRFLSEKRVILYTISSRPPRTCTRLHDLAAVHDTSKREIHLVPHRTQYRSVTLN
jgi:hypothetical protein